MPLVFTPVASYFGVLGNTVSFIGQFLVFPFHLSGCLAYVHLCRDENPFGYLLLCLTPVDLIGDQKAYSAVMMSGVATVHKY